MSKEKIFIFWHDYDGNYIEEFAFDEKYKAEQRCTEILERRDYGVQIDAVIQGKMLTMKTVKMISKVSLT